MQLCQLALPLRQHLVQTSFVCVQRFNLQASMPHHGSSARNHCHSTHVSGQDELKPANFLPNLARVIDCTLEQNASCCLTR